MTMKTPMSTAETAKQIKVLLKPIKDERADAARLDDLRRLFAQQDVFSLSTPNTTPAIQKWKAFLATHLDMFVAQLMDRMDRKTAIRTFWGVIAACPSYTPQRRHPFVSQSLLLRWFSKLPPLTGDRALRHMVESEFLHQFVDVQYYAYLALTQLTTDQYARDKMDTDKASRLFQLLTMLPRLKSQEEVDAGTFLFQPPTSGTPEEELHQDQSQDDDDQEQSQDDDDDDDSSEQESDDDDQVQKHVAKKQKMEPKIVRVLHYQHLKVHRRVMARAWFAILKLDLPLQDLKYALQVLPTQVLPFIPNPLRFADFFVQAYGTHGHEQGGVIPILSLDGLFLLMMDHGLEYPSFYGSLYRLIQPSLFYVKYRIRFFELLINCLTKNDMLPAHVVAAFIKRLGRAALHAPPSGCLFCLALISNLIRRHPECACLIHRTGSVKKNKNAVDAATTNNTDVNEEEDTNKYWQKDPYNAKTNDPAESHALESSLWECKVLSKHYLPAVATMAQSIGQEQGPMYDMSDFMSHTYKSLFDQERKRIDGTTGSGSSTTTTTNSTLMNPTKKQKKKIPLAFTKPVGLFTETDVFAGMISCSHRGEGSQQ